MMSKSANNALVQVVTFYSDYVGQLEAEKAQLVHLLSQRRPALTQGHRDIVQVTAELVKLWHAGVLATDRGSIPDNALMMLEGLLSKLPTEDP